MFDFLPEFLRTPVSFVIVLSILVFIHELGHYLAARWRGVHVDVFSIGFGRAIATWKDGHGTIWKLSWIPLGGYVKLHGQERPEDVAPEVRASWIVGRTFHSKTVVSRAIVVAAGPAANFVLAAVLFTALFMAIGRPVGVEPVVGEVLADSAASKAGLLAGDRIVGIDADPVANFTDIQRIVASHADVPIILHVQRAGAARDIPITPFGRDGGNGRRVGVLGIQGGEVIYERVTPIDAVVAGVGQTWDLVVQTLDGLWGMLSGRRGGELGGPLAIAQLSGQVAQHGASALIKFIAFMSVNLGLLNLFPIPVLDGGHLLFYLAEAIRGRPLPQRTQEYGFRAGFALLIGLFVFATWNDLVRIGVFSWIAHLIG